MKKSTLILITSIIGGVIAGGINAFVRQEIKKQDEEVDEMTQQFAEDLVSEAFPKPNFDEILHNSKES